MSLAETILRFEVSIFKFLASRSFEERQTDIVRVMPYKCPIKSWIRVAKIHLLTMVLILRSQMIAQLPLRPVRILSLFLQQ